MSLLKQVALRAAVTALIGGICGFVIPGLRDYESNIAPLFGLALGGSMGFVLGAGLGLLFQLFHLRPFARESSFAAACALLVAGEFFLFEPKNPTSGFLVDAEIVRCEVPMSNLQAPAATPVDALGQDGERDRLIRLIRDDPGVVLWFKIHRTRDIYSSRNGVVNAPPRAGSWSPTLYENRAFARWRGNACSSYPVATRGVYWMHQETTGRATSLSSTVPALLSLSVIEPVPEGLAALAR